MDRKIAKELLHIQGWLERADEITRDGQNAYSRDGLRQEAGDSVMMKIGEAANRLSRLGFVAPERVEWTTIVRDLSEWRDALSGTFADATAELDKT